jgi:uncharacterized protein YaiE (UPF0345 family)
MKNLLQGLSSLYYKLLFFLLVLFTNTTSANAQCGMTINTTITNVSCYNGTNGGVSISVTGGSAPYQYQLAEAGAGAWSSTSTFGGLAASTYPVSVKDATGCVKTIYISVTQPANYVINYTANDVTCTGGNNGSISVNVTGGTTPYTYTWTKNGTAFATTPSISGLYPADYKLIVTDASGCTTSPIVLEQIKSIGLTGFNEDVVANGTHTAPASATSQAFDDGNGNVFYEDGYSNASWVSETPGGLPSGGNFASTQSASRVYQLASYSSNNSLLLRSSTATTYGGATSGTLSFASQYRSTYNTLYVLASTGSGTGTVDYTVNYADGSTSTGQLTFADWYLVSSAQSAVKTKRIERSTGTYDTRYDFNLFELPITISGANQNKVINSIGFAWSNAGSARVNIMAITGYTATAYGIHINDGSSGSVTPDVSITSSAPSNTFCTGQSVTFTAVPVNGGVAPSYQWKKNGSNISGATSSTYTTSSLSNNDVIKVRMTSDLPCVTSTTASSNSLTMINGTATASVSLSATATAICSGTQVTFTANPVNGGTTPSYQWKLNNNNIGSNSPTWVCSTLNDNDQVKLVMTSSIGCALSNPASSGTVTVGVTNNLQPAVSITSSPAVIYNGMPVIFTATPVNGGLLPLYQWYKNGNNIPGAILPLLIIPSAYGGDMYSVKLTSSLPCTVTPFAMSNYIPVSYSVLPISLEWYTARPDNNKALLQWKTAQEFNNKQFILERANNNAPTSYTTVGYVPATQSANGATYNFTDNPGAAGIYLYRLMQQDIDGTKRSLGIRKVNLNGKTSWAIQDLGSTWQLSCNGTFPYRLLDASGRLIKTGQATGNISINKPTSSGIYLLQFETGGETFIQKLIK